MDKAKSIYWLPNNNGDPLREWLNNELEEIEEPTTELQGIRERIAALKAKTMQVVARSKGEVQMWDGHTKEVTVADLRIDLPGITAICEEINTLYAEYAELRKDHLAGK